MISPRLVAALRATKIETYTNEPIATATAKAS